MINIHRTMCTASSILFLLCEREMQAVKKMTPKDRRGIIVPAISYFICTRSLSYMCTCFICSRILLFYAYITYFLCSRILLFYAYITYFLCLRNLFYMRTCLYAHASSMRSYLILYVRAPCFKCVFVLLLLLLI